MTFRNAVLVVGPPRSGTSAVCHVLNECGVDFGDPAGFIDPASNTHNPVFFELLALNSLNERMMARMGWTYRDFNALPLKRDFSSALMDEFEQDVAKLIAQFNDVHWFGLKDPRFCFTLPLWTGLLSRLAVRSKILRTRRDPEAVAASNFQLSPGRGIDYGRRIATLSDSAAAYFLSGVAHEVVNFEDLRGGTERAVRALATIAAVEQADVLAACKRVFRDDLVHWRAPTSTVNAGDAGAIDYEKLAELVRHFGLQPGGGEDLPSGSCESAIAQTDLNWVDQAPIVEGPVQVYYRCQDELFGEERSVQVPWPSRDREETISVELPRRAGEYFRVDVNTSPGAYLIDTLSIDGVDVKPLSVLLDANGAAYELPNGAVGLVANHCDPWLSFRAPNGAASSLTVHIRRMTPDEVGFRLFEDRVLELSINDLQHRISQTDDRTTDHVARLRDAMDEGYGNLIEQLRSMGARLSDQIKDHIACVNTTTDECMREFVQQVQRVDSIEKIVVDMHQVQKSIFDSRVKEEKHMREALAEARKISLMGWWERRKFKKGNQ